MKAGEYESNPSAVDFMSKHAAILDNTFWSWASSPDVCMSMLSLDILQLKIYDAIRSMTPSKFQNKTEWNEVDETVF